MASVSKERRPVKAVHGCCRWAVQPTSTHPGCLVINDVAYLVHENRHGALLLGYRLTKRDGTAYDLEADQDGNPVGCDCPDAVRRERPGGCKHRKSLVAALAALAQ